MTTLSHKQQLELAAQVLETEIFGAFWLAIEARREESGLTQTQLAERTGRDKTNISKLLDGPRNWTLKTISDLAEALNVQVELVLKDRESVARSFTPTGVRWESAFVFTSFPDVIEYMAPSPQAITASTTSLVPYMRPIPMVQGPARLLNFRFVSSCLAIEKLLSSLAMRFCFHSTGKFIQMEYIQQILGFLIRSVT